MTRMFIFAAMMAVSLSAHASTVTLTATPGAASANLTWTVSNGAINAQEVYRDTDSNPSGRVRIATLDVNARSYSATGLTNGVTYYFTIEAVNAAGPGPRSDPRTSVRVGGTAPAAPTIGAVVVTGDQASIAWTPGAAGDAAISGYIIQYSADGSTQVTVAQPDDGDIQLGDRVQVVQNRQGVAQVVRQGQRNPD